MLRFTIVVALLITSLSTISIAQPVIRITHDGVSIESSFQKAFSKGMESEDFWIGYSIHRDSETQISIGSFYMNDDDALISLRDVIDNNADYQKFRKDKLSNKKSKHLRSYRIINGRIVRHGEPTIDKEFALLFRYDRSSTGIDDFAEISMCNLSLYVDLEDHPLFWLGYTNNESSFSFVTKLYNKSNTTFAKEELVPAVGVHTAHQGTTNFLSDIYSRAPDEEIAEESLFWIGQQNNRQAFTILKDAIKNGDTEDVREEAVMSLGFMELPGVIDYLITVAKQNPERELRERAIHALGHKAVEKAEQALKNFVENDPDIELKKHAIYALSNNDNDNLPYLIKIAKTHSSVTLRKAAIYSIANYEDDERAVDALIDLAKR